MNTPEPKLTPPTILGEHPLAHDAAGNLISRIGTIFLRGNILITLPGVHATQRLAYSDYLNQQRAATGQPPLTADEEAAEWEQSVDLIMEDGIILIRPDPENMDAAFVADELLQRLVSKRQVRFLNVMDVLVRQAIKEHGESWRISPLPQSPDEMQHMIRDARIAIGGRALYYYSTHTGTRFLTCAEFAGLAALPPAELARHLNEIREYSGHRNRRHHREVDFFAANNSFGHDDFAGPPFSAADPAALRARFDELNARFQRVVPTELRADDPQNLAWRNRMFSALIGQRDQTVADELLHGLSPEFFMQIHWLPGGRVEDGELLFDPIFEEYEKNPADPALANLCDEKVKGFIFNFIREFGDVEYVNLGRIATALSQRPRAPGRRDVYLAEIKQRDHSVPVTRIIRMQKWDTYERLEEGKDLLKAILESEDYTEYILDRRLGCRQLGMNLPTNNATRRIFQPYRGQRKEYTGQMLGFTYFERDYMNGVATDKIPAPKYRLPDYPRRLARLLGTAAAASLIVGKADPNGKAIFDDGDEVLIEDAHGLPDSIVTCDPTGTFANYKNELTSAAEDYALPVNKRLALLPDPAAFAQDYLDALIEQFQEIQEHYRSRKRGFDALFRHHRRDERGSFAYRWEKVLERLGHTDATALRDSIRRCIRLPA